MCLPSVSQPPIRARKNPPLQADRWGGKAADRHAALLFPRYSTLPIFSTTSVSLRASLAQ